MNASIKSLTDNYNGVLEDYLDTNNTLTGLDSYKILSDTSIPEIKSLTKNYNRVLEDYMNTNKSLSTLGSYKILNKKTISGGTTSDMSVLPSVTACQAKCAKMKCSYAAYNSNTKGCRITKNVNNVNITNASSSKKVIADKQLYKLNQLKSLNTQLSNINDQLMAKINSYDVNDTLNAGLNAELTRIKRQLDKDRSALSQGVLNTNMMDNPNMLDLEYIRQDEELDTNSYYYVFLLSLLICIVAIAVIISMQK
jgi:hypothetical protein